MIVTLISTLVVLVSYFLILLSAVAFIQIRDSINLLQKKSMMLSAMKEKEVKENI